MNIDGRSITAERRDQLEDRVNAAIFAKVNDPWAVITPARTAVDAVLSELGITVTNAEEH